MNAPRFGIGDRIVMNWLWEEREQTVTDFGEVIGISQSIPGYEVDGRWWYCIRFDYMPTGQELCPYIDWVSDSEELDLDNSVHLWLHTLGFVQNPSWSKPLNQVKTRGIPERSGGYAAKGLDGR